MFHDFPVISHDFPMIFHGFPWFSSDFSSTQLPGLTKKRGKRLNTFVRLNGAAAVLASVGAVGRGDSELAKTMGM